MKPEILLKAYVMYQSDDAFRELVTSSLDEVYSTAVQIVESPPHLVEETVLRVYWELARKAPSLTQDGRLACWLHEYTCKMAVRVLREEDRSVDRAALKKQRRTLFREDGVEPAPEGLATRVCQGILLHPGLHKRFHFSLRRFGSAWAPLARIGRGILCVLVVSVLLWKIPFHRRNPIIVSPDVEMTPASFAQIAGAEEGAVLPETLPTANTNPPINLK